MNKKIRGSALAAIICALLLAFSAAFIFSGGVVSTPVSSAEEQQDATFISGIDNLAVTQVVNGHGAWENDDTFSFSIKAKEKYQGVTLPKDTKVVITKDTPNHVAAFGDIIFTTYWSIFIHK